MSLIDRLFPSRIKQMEAWTLTRGMGQKVFLKKLFHGWSLLYMLFLSTFSAMIFSGMSLPFWLLFPGCFVFWALTGMVFRAANWHINEREYRDYQSIKES